MILNSEIPFGYLMILTIKVHIIELYDERSITKLSSVDLTILNCIHGLSLGLITLRCLR